MGWRTVVIKSRCKLSFKNNYLVVFGDDGEQTIHIDEIGTLIVENTAISLTAYLLCELGNHKVKVIFCDQKKNPHSEMISYYGAHNMSKRLRLQAGWPEVQKGLFWQAIVRQKLQMQAAVVQKAQMGSGVADELWHLMNDVQVGDATNREAYAARIYFRELFGDRFVRNTGDNIDAALNYGYSLILSNFNREIVAAGYSTALGLNHVNEYNPFNLACDLMEPFRPMVDLYVFERRMFAFDDYFKEEMIKMLEKKITINGTSQYVPHGIHLYTTGFFRAIDQSDIRLLANITL